MSDLPPEVQALIDDARGGHDPSPDAERRVRRGIAAALLVGGATVTGATSLAHAGAPVGAAAWLTLSKGVLIASLCVGGAGAAWIG